MSRIIVKNLPKKITEERVRELFSTKGLITDVQLKYTSNGRFRQFCFVGYQTEDEAKSAIEHFNNTRINTSKVIVELCASLGDQTKPKAWSKHTATAPIIEESDTLVKENPKEGSEKKNKKTKDANKDSLTQNLLEKYKDDPMFEEFLEVHDKAEAEELKRIKNKKPEVESEEEDENKTLETNGIEEPKEVTDLEYLQQLKTKSKKVKEPKQLELFTLKLRNLPYNTKKRDLKQFFKPVTPFTIRVPRNVKGIAYAAFKQEKQLTKALLKDKSFLNGKQISVMKYNNTKEINTSEQEGLVAIDAKRTRWKEQEDSLKNEEEIGESGKIFMRNLSYLTTEEDVEKLFNPFGPVAEVLLPIDTETRKSKGFGTVTFLMPEHAVRAYSRLDGAVLHGRMLHLLPAKSNEPPPDTSQPTSFKDRKQDALKANAASSHNWNALFLGADAVAEVAAERHGATKADVVLNDAGGDSSAAVRLALAETQLVTETRKYLMGEGVDLTAFTQLGTKRSKTIILVKNLPAHTEARELKNIFEKFGVIGRIILPPGGISALIEFLEPSEARKAFTNLAYSKFKHLPLYLEWAPEGSLLDKKDIKEDNKDVKIDSEDSKLKNTPDEKVAVEDEEEEEEEEEGTTLFVKNLNFNTTDDALKQHFGKCGKIKYANVATKRQGQGSKMTVLSMGYGFVRFYTKESADNALKTLQYSELNEKSLEIKRSERTLQKGKEHVAAEATRALKQRSKVKQTGTKILIRNIPFQANLAEVTQLFKVFGEMKAIRLPKKMGTGGSTSSQHRGFGFADYVTKSDAKRAFEALGESTHLYGRRLVLEWAAKDIDDANGESQKEEEVENLRKRTAKHFARSQQEGGTKKSKKSILNAD